MNTIKPIDNRRMSSTPRSVSITDSVTAIDNSDNVLNPPGLTNLGNTCYINATLQCLLTIQPLVDWLLSQPHSNSPGQRGLEGPALTAVLSDLVVAIFKRNCTAELEKFRQVIGELVKDFKEPREQDAQEFLLFLLNRLRDENLVVAETPNSHTSEISSIFEGVLRTQLLCPQCTSENQNSKCNFFKGRGSKASKGNTEVFLSLSLPIPVQEHQLKAAIDTVDSNACDLNVIFNEIIDSSPIICYRRLLKLHPSADMQSIYNQVFSLLNFFDPTPSGKHPHHHQPKTLNIQKDYRESFEDFNSPSTQDPFLLVQAKSTGFGEWFLESSGCALDLTDGLNVEDDFSLGPTIMSSNIKQSLLTGDALFIVRLISKLATDDPQMSAATFPSAILSSAPASGTVDDSKSQIGCGHQILRSNSSKMSEGSMQLLLVHVKELENRNPIDCYNESLGSSLAANFRRFSPPISVNVPNDIRFDDLRLLVLESLKVCCGTKYDESLALDANKNVRFWIVDAAPGEPREIDSQQEFPLLHSTIEVSSILLPQWLAREGLESLRLLRLLVVWPYTFRYCNPTIQVRMDATLAEAVSSDVGVVENYSSSSLRLKSKTSKDDGLLEQNSSSALTIMKCLEEFKKSTNVSKIDNFSCPKCKKSQSSVLLTTKIKKAPNYLLLHLNRFVHISPSLGGGNGLLKVNSLVNYPVNNLDLSFMMDPPNRTWNSRKSKDWSSVDQGKPVYELVAVCSHKGSIETGHITAYCRNPFTQQWWHYNDLKVQKVSPDQVVQPSAYLLFYKRKNSDNLAALRRTQEKVERIAGKRRDQDHTEKSQKSLKPPEVAPKPKQKIPPKFVNSTTNASSNLASYSTATTNCLKSRPGSKSFVFYQSTDV